MRLHLAGAGVVAAEQDDWLEFVLNEIKLWTGFCEWERLAAALKSLDLP